MKIDRIAIENLASLRGRQPDLELTGGELEEVGLIAITGPTGAGKTTVLDAVCLALFDRTPRLRGRGQDPRELLTRGAASARAVIDLTLDDGTRWCCEWSVHRARNRPDGALQPARQRITDGTTGEILADGKRDVQALVERHLGLSFEQFTGVILLAQGAFATFLESSDAERSALLERLTGTEIYSRLGQAAFERHKALRQEVEAEESRWRDAEPLAAARRHALEQEVDELEPNLVRLEAHQVALEQRLAWLDRRLLLEERVLEARASLGRVRAESSAAEPDRKKAREAEEAMALAGSLEAADAASERAENSAHRLAQAKEERHRTGDDLKNARARFLGTFAQLLDLGAEAAEELSRLAPLEAASPEARTELRDRRRDGEAQEAARERQAAELVSRQQEAAAADAHAERTESAARQIGTERRRLDEVLADLESRRRQSLGQVSKEALVARELRLEQAEGVRRELEELDPERLRETLAGADLALRKAETHYEAAEALAIGAQRELGHEEKMLRLAERGAELFRHRHDLAAGEPCPLCGSLDHPRQALDDAEDELAALRDAETKVDSLKLEVRRRSAELATAESEVRQAVVDKEQAEQRLDEAARAQRDLTSSWLTLRLQLIDLPPEPFEIEVRALAAERQETKDRLESFAAFDAEEKELRERLGSIAAELGEAEKERAVATERRAEAKRHLDLARGRDAEAEDLRLEAWRRWHRAATELAESCSLDAPAPPTSDRGAPDTTFEERLERGCRDFAKAKSQKERLEALQARVRSRASSWFSAQALDTETLDTEAIDAEALDSEAIGTPREAPGAERREESGLNPVRGARPLGALNVESLTTALEKELGGLEESAHRHRLAVDRLEHADSSHKAEEAESGRVRNLLMAQLRRSPFANVEELRAATLTNQALETLREKLRDLDLEIERKRTELDRHEEELGLHMADEDKGRNPLAADPRVSDPEGEGTEEERPRLANDLRDARTRLRHATDRKLTLRVELQRDDERRQKRQELEERLEDLRHDRDRAARLAELIGQKDGGKFRRFAQQLNLDQLLGLANARLERLAPRYALARLGHGLELEVIDREMADERRPTSTLSGGESFLVSLALALGLADLRRGQLRLGTLFLDEGFGSLDEDTLEMALATLEQLQAEQSTQILIISHVGALQERIAHRIAVEKRGGGRSRLRLIAGESESPTN